MLSTIITVLATWTILLLGYNVTLVMRDSQSTAGGCTWRRRGLLAGLLALLTVAVLIPGVDTLLSSTTVSSGVARLPLSTQFAIHELLPGAIRPFHTYVSVDLVNALFNGFFGTAAPFDVECPSGNCVWDDTYTTLAVCSSCTSLTNELQPLTDDNGDNVGIKLPNGFSLRYNAQFGLPIGEHQSYDNMAVTASAYGSLPVMREREFESIAFEDMPGKFNDMFVLVGSDPKASTFMSESPEPAAYECAMQWCLQQSTAKMVNGKLTEKLVKVIKDGAINLDDPENDPRKKLSRQIKDPATGLEYNVTMFSEYTMSFMLARMLNGTRSANITADAEPLTILFDAVTRPKDSPAKLYEHLASTITTFMRTNNSAIIDAHYSSAEGSVKNHLAASKECSWTFTAYPFLALAAVGLLALTSRPQKPVHLEHEEDSKSLLHSEKLSF